MQTRYLENNTRTYVRIALYYNIAVKKKEKKGIALKNNFGAKNVCCFLGFRSVLHRG